MTVDPATGCRMAERAAIAAHEFETAQDRIANEERRQAAGAFPDFSRLNHWHCQKYGAANAMLVELVALESETGCSEEEAVEEMQRFWALAQKSGTAAWMMEGRDIIPFLRVARATCRAYLANFASKRQSKIKGAK